MAGDYPAGVGVVWCGEPRSFTGGRDTPVRLSVVHTTEGHAGATAAEDGCTIDKNRTDGTSCHVFHDNDSSRQEVLRRDTAHSAFYHGNTLGVHHEQCGTASWTSAQWSGGYQRAMIRRMARAVADDCVTYGLEPRRLSVAEVRRAFYGPAPYPKGICGHIDITNAFPEDPGSHTDPGPNFPWADFISMVKLFMSGSSTKESIMRYAFDGSWPDRPASLTSAGGNVVIVTDGLGMYFTQFVSFQLNECVDDASGVGVKTLTKGPGHHQMPTTWSFDTAFEQITGGCTYSDAGRGVASWQTVEVELSTEDIDAIAVAVADKVDVCNLEHDAIVDAIHDGLEGVAVNFTSTGKGTLVVPE
jgi:hypothetical protein